MGNILPYFALFGANLIYAINYGVAKDVMGEGYLESFSFILIRVVGAVILFWLVSAFKVKESIDKADIVKFALCGLFGVAANQLMFFEGLHNTSTINASIIMVTNPILVLLLASFILREKMSLRRISGVFIGLTGAILLILYKNPEGGNVASLKGDLLVLFNAASYGVYLILAKPLMQKYTPLTVVKWTFTFGMLFVIPFGGPQIISVNWEMPTDIVIKIIYVVVFTTFFAYLLNIYGLKKVSPTVTSSFIYLQPVLTSIIAVVFGTEMLSWEKVIYGVIIFIGVFLVSVPVKKKLKTV